MAEGDADLLLLVAASMVLAVVVAGCMKSSDDGSTGAARPAGAAGAAAVRGGAAARGAAGAGGQRAAAAIKPMSARAKALQRELGLPFGAAATFTTHHVLFADTKHPHARWTPRPEALAVLRLLLEFMDVFLLNEVKEHEEDEAALKQGLLEALRAAGVVRPSKSADFGVEEHKVLFYSTAVGKQAVARQVRPQLHVDYAREVAQYLVPHVPQLLLVQPSAAGDRPDAAAPYRVLSSLGALLELLPPAEEQGSAAAVAGLATVEAAVAVAEGVRA